MNVKFMPECFYCYDEPKRSEKIKMARDIISEMSDNEISDVIENQNKIIAISDNDHDQFFLFEIRHYNKNSKYGMPDSIVLDWAGSVS